MPSFNKVIIVGNITRDLELRYTPGGAAVVDIGLAVNDKWRDKDGELHEEVCFVDVVVWNRQAENVAQYQKKGSPILVEGRLKQDTWDDKTTGEKRSKLKVTAERIQFLGAPKGDDADRGDDPEPAPAKQGYGGKGNGGGGYPRRANY